MTRISDQTEKTYTDVTDQDSIQFAVADVQVSTPGSAGMVTLTTLKRLSEYRIVTSTTHGLNSGDVGKPLSGASILDDTSATAFPTWVLVEAIDADTLRVCQQGQIAFADTLLDAGYVLGTDGPYMYWDESAGTYVATRPSDTDARIREVIYVLDVSGGTCTANVLGWGPA